MKEAELSYNNKTHTKHGFMLQHGWFYFLTEDLGVDQVLELPDGVSCSQTHTHAFSSSRHVF